MKYSASEPERQVVYAYADDIKAKDAEIERLKAVLATIAGSKPQNFDAAILRAIASGALASG